MVVIPLNSTERAATCYTCYEFYTMCEDVAMN